jgi:hypothetical protein
MNWQAEAKKLWGNEAAWIDGDGPFALLARCRTLTVTLWGTRDEAERQKSIIDGTGCGDACNRAHEIVDMSASN